MRAQIFWFVVNVFCAACNLWLIRGRRKLKVQVDADLDKVKLVNRETKELLAEIATRTQTRRMS